MKKLLFITTLAVVAFMIGQQAQSKLQRLHKEVRRLESVTGRRNSQTGIPTNKKRIRQERTPDSAGETLTDARSAEIRSTIRNIYGAFYLGMGGPQEKAELDKLVSLYDAFASLNHKDALRLIKDCENDSSLPFGVRDNSRRVIIGALMEVNAKEAVLLLLSNDRMSNDDELHWCFTAWARQDLSGAQRWFEQETDKGGNTKRLAEMAVNLATAYSRIDPDRAISLATSDVANLHPNSAEGWMDSLEENQFRTVEDYRGFLAALKRADERKPDSNLISPMRTRLIAHLCRDRNDWPQEEFTLLMESEFTPKDKKQVEDIRLRAIESAINQWWGPWRSDYPSH